MVDFLLSQAPCCTVNAKGSSPIGGWEICPRIPSREISTTLCRAKLVESTSSFQALLRQRSTSQIPLLAPLAVDASIGVCQPRGGAPLHQECLKERTSSSYTFQNLYQNKSIGGIPAYHANTEPWLEVSGFARTLLWFALNQSATTTSLCFDGPGRKFQGLSS